MKIIIAPNAFKGSLSAQQAARAIDRGIARVLPDSERILVPVADGGDGLMDVAQEALSGEIRKVLVTGPRFDPVEAGFCHVPSQDLAVIEMALASGLAILSEDRQDPTMTTTVGTGELIKTALDLDVKRIIVGIGGSATNDGGMGMASALGVLFLDKDQKILKPVGKSLSAVSGIDMSGLDSRINKVRIEVVCDVDNPLIGPQGAARIYGPQKGANPEQVALLDQGLTNLAELIEETLHTNVRLLPGAGAAGGLGAGLHAFFGAELRKGVDLVLDIIGLEEKLQGADLVVTGEGQIDYQTAFGKAPAGVASAAKNHGIPCIAIAGSVGDELGGLYQTGLDAVFSLCPGPVTLEEAMREGETYLERMAEQVVRCFLAGIYS